MAGFLTILTGLGSVLGGPLRYAAERFDKWSERRDALKDAQLKAELAKLTAEAELAAYKVKADTEWDLAWAGQAQSSWKDEYLLILWSLPFIASVFMLFIPGLRDQLQETIQFITTSFGSQAFYWYFGGWGVIFSATYGMKGATQLMVPGTVSKVAEVLSNLPDDIPDDAADVATAKIRELIKSGKEGLF